MQGTAQLVGTLGPAIAGFAVALIGVGAAFAIDALSFAVAAGALWLVRSGARPGHPADPDEPDAALAIVDPGADADTDADDARSSLAGALVAGAREVLGEPVMRAIVIVSTATNLAFTGPTVIGLPWLVLVHFGSTAFALGLLFAAYGAGSLGGVLIAGSTRRPRRFGSIVLGLVLAMGLGLAAIGLAPSLPIVAASSCRVGAMNGYVGVVVIAWVQGRTDPAMLGRTMSFMMLGSVIAAPISLALAAIVVDTHAGTMFVAAGLLVVGAGSSRSPAASSAG